MARSLTATSFLVLTLVERLAPATAYDLKRVAQMSVFNFWSLPHSVLYRETQQLDARGLLRSEQEPSGRQRRLYTLTAAGQAALDAWRAEPTSDFLELHDPGLLRLFAGTDPRALAALQRQRHQMQLDTYHALHRQLADSGLPDGMRLALEAGIGIEREYVRFWAEVAEQGADARPDANASARQRMSSD